MSLVALSRGQVAVGWWSGWWRFAVTAIVVAGGDVALKVAVKVAALALTVVGRKVGSATRRRWWWWWWPGLKIS